MSKKLDNEFDYADIPLLTKQVIALDYLHDETTTEVVYGGGARGGKAQPLESLVLTPFGFKKMGDIKIGDRVSHPSGSNSGVIAIHPQGLKDIYKVTFNDGSNCECCNEHLWYYWKARKKNTKFNTITGIQGRIATTEMLRDGLKKNHSYLIPLTNPVQFTITSRYEKLSDKISPYILGVLIGDGSLTKGFTFTSADPEIIERVRDELPEGFTVNKQTSDYGYSIVVNQRNKKGYVINPLKEVIVSMGLDCKSEHKFIPKEYFTAPLEKRIALVQGLMDTDGTSKKDGSNSYFCSSSKQLAEDMRYMLMSLGAKVTISEKPTDCLLAYNLTIQSNNNDLFFHLKRKKDRQVKFASGEVGRRIVSIEYVGKKEAQCITVSSPDGLYITNDFIVTHNSWLGCSWVVDQCLNYEGVRYLIGRSRLKDLMNTTYKTFIKVLNKLGLERGVDYSFNGSTHVLTFFQTGSEVIFMDLYHYPHDPEYTKLGSLELTGAFLDECGEIPHLAKTIVISRLSEGLDENGLIPKLLMTCNPKKNWLYFDYYLPYIKNELPENVQFIISLVDDNKFISKAYIKVLENLGDNTQVRRLRYGDWEYENEDESLFNYKSILDGFTNKHVMGGLWYMTCDCARYGRDFLVICIWQGLRVVEMYYLDKSSIPLIVEMLKAYGMKYKIPRSRWIIDDGGSGGGATDYLPGCYPFDGASRVVDEENYRNLRQQCYYRLSECYKDAEIFVDIEKSNPTKVNVLKEYIINDLQAIERKNTDSGGYLEIISKDKIVEKLHRSPDFGDALMMRMVFHKKKVRFGLDRLEVEEAEYEVEMSGDYTDYS